MELILWILLEGKLFQDTYIWERIGVENSPLQFDFKHVEDSYIIIKEMLAIEIVKLINPIFKFGS